MVSYEGWIPTITGRLAFRLIGDCDSRSMVAARNVTNEQTRLILCCQFRDLSDSALPSGLFGWMFGSKVYSAAKKLKGRFWFVLWAKGERKSESPTISSLSGSVLIYRDAPKWNRIQNQGISAGSTAFEKIADMQERLKLWNDKLQQGERVESLSNLFLQGSQDKRLLDDLTIQCDARVDFDLDRAGMLKIFMHEPAAFSPLAPRLPSDERAANRLRKYICTQSYYFIKDLTHTHQHHDTTTDTLLDIYNSEEENWQYSTLRSLFRKAIQLKRSKDPADYSDSIGLLAYARSFKSLVTDSLQQPDKSGGLKANNDIVFDEFSKVLDREFLEQSINSARSSIVKQIDDSRYVKNRRRQWMIGLVAIVIALVGLLRLAPTQYNDVQVDPLLDCLGRLILEEPLWMLALVSFMMLAYFKIEGSIDAAEMPISLSS